MNLLIRKILSSFTRLLPNKKAFCFRCGITDAFADFHPTLVAEIAMEFWVLCKPCFAALKPTERLEFYQKFFKHYENYGQGFDGNKKELIERAVLWGE
jgi:hypothetical protein